MSFLEPLTAPYRTNLPLVPETRFDALLEAYRPFERARKALPYNADEVQAFGLAFCPLFIGSKENICQFLNSPIEEFDYSSHWKLMPQLKVRLGVTNEGSY